MIHALESIECKSQRAPDYSDLSFFNDFPALIDEFTGDCLRLACVCLECVLACVYVTAVCLIRVRVSVCVCVISLCWCVYVGVCVTGVYWRVCEWSVSACV